MFTGNTITVSYLKELMEAVHDWTEDTFRLALYDSTATLNRSTIRYTATGEITGTNYTAGGIALTVSTEPTAGANAAYAGFANPTFTNITVSGVRGALIYNDSTELDSSVMVLDFGQTISKTAEDWTITMPTADELNAIMRLKIG